MCLAETFEPVQGELRGLELYNPPVCRVSLACNHAFAYQGIYKLRDSARRDAGEFRQFFNRYAFNFMGNGKKEGLPAAGLTAFHRVAEPGGAYAA